MTPRHALLRRIRDLPGTLRLATLSRSESHAAREAFGYGEIPSLASGLVLTPTGRVALDALDELQAARTDPRQQGLL